MDKELRDRLDILSAYMSNPLTEEQKEFASDFTKPVISFSDPGTGKTHTTVAGLVMAQTHHRVPGDKIFCMSFTRAATSEISARYSALCKRIGMTANVNFGTFHALSHKIMKEAYPEMTIQGYLKYKDDVPRLAKIMSDIGMPQDDFNRVKNILNAIMNLNSSFTFDGGNLDESYTFQRLNISVSDFQELRKRWFLSCLTRKTITQGDIPIFCLNALLRFEHIVKKWRGRYSIMVVDEFQDLSLLHLKILSLVAENLVVIGDIKQQIYGFNGACTKIVEQYLATYPNARIKNLTKSFRCKDEIASFAKKIIAPNNAKYGEGSFEGTGEGGRVSIINTTELNWKDICSGIKADIDKNTISNARDVLFLYRNNASATPVIEGLYQEGIPFRCPKFKRVMDLPIFSDLCKMADLATDSYNEKYATDVLRMCPEYARNPIGDVLPPIRVMRETHKDIFTIPYTWSNQETYNTLMGIRRAQISIEKGCSASIVLNHCLDAYDKYIIKGKWWRFDMDKDFYMRLVAPLCANKTYERMVNDENDKLRINQEDIDGGYGVRCYTMHGAKGLEADDVYILDAEDGMFPNHKEMERMVEAGCSYQAACTLRDERNLLFVACTRAKETVTVSYATSVTPLLATPNDTPYTFLDEVYVRHNERGDDTKTFYELYNMGGLVN